MLSTSVIVVLGCQIVVSFRKETLLTYLEHLPTLY